MPRYKIMKINDSHAKCITNQVLMSEHPTLEKAKKALIEMMARYKKISEPFNGFVLDTKKGERVEWTDVNQVL